MENLEHRTPHEINNVEAVTAGVSESFERHKEAFAYAERKIAEALRDNNVSYTIYSSVAFDRQLERVLATTLEPKEFDGDQIAATLAARARELITQVPGDIDGVVKSRKDLRDVRRALLRINNFIPDPSVGSQGEVRLDNDGFRKVYGEDDTVVFSGFFRYLDPADINQSPVLVPVEFYCEQKINTPKLQDMSEVVDEYGLRVLSLPALREQYANTLTYEQEVDSSIEEKRKDLHFFCAEIEAVDTEEQGQLYELFSLVNGFPSVVAAQYYLNEFIHNEERVRTAANDQERTAALAVVTAQLEGLKTKTKIRREKVRFLDDLNYFLDTGNDPSKRH